MADILINLNHIAAQIDLPADVVAKRMTFVNPLCILLSAGSANTLREYALRMLKLQYHFMQRPPADDVPAILARAYLLENLVDSYNHDDPAFTSFKGDTFDERMKAWKKQERAYQQHETALFDTDPNLWWEHRVKESYNYHMYLDRVNAHYMRKSKGCIIPIVFCCSIGCGVTLWFLCS
jgi:hypothetical protein